MFDFIDKIIAEATASQIQRKQQSITRLFPTFFDRTKAVASAGGLKLHDINVNTWYFRVHSGTESDVWYDDVVHFVNVVPLLDKLVKDQRLWIADGSRVDRSKLARQFLDQVDIKLSCSCSAALYWGSDYILSLNKYRARYGDPETRSPRIRNPKQYGAVCKHMHNVLRVLPFYITTITKWLTQFYDKDIAGFEAEAKKELSKYKVAGAELGKKKKEVEKEKHPVFAKESKLSEEVAIADVDLQKQVKDYYKNKSKELTLSTWSSKKESKWYKFFILTDGTIIPVGYSHESTIKLAGLTVGREFIETGAIAGYIDGVTKEMGVETGKKLTTAQISRLINLYIQYGVKNIVASIGNKDWNSDVKSSDHLDYLLMYGPDKDVEEKLKKLEEDLANISDPKLRKMFIEDKIEDLEVKIRSLERLAKTLNKGDIQSSLYSKIDNFQKEISLLKKSLE
jgi:hypothetical protein